MKIQPKTSKTVKNIYNTIKKSVGDYTNKSQKVVEETLNEIKQKTEPKIREAISYVEFSINPPKKEVLAKECTKLEKQYIFTTAYLNQVKNTPNPDIFKILKLEKELKLLEQKTIATRDKYNNFVAKQNAAQAAFNSINNF